ncbi:MAG: CRISPR-associated helicase Cas3', partial [Mailhella sp.]|nr:CRISPR-associated helicase Cas3' [Mailhella sp.]
MRSRRTSKEEERETIPLESCLAKTWAVATPEGELRTLPGRTVEDHSRIAMAVAARLLAMMPETVRGIYPEHSEYVCGIHDVGKVSPIFERKLYAALGRDGEWPQLLSAPLELEQSIGYHYSISRACMRRILPGQPEIGEAAGWHHGREPVKQDAGYSLYGGEPWQALREELCRRINPQGLWPSAVSPVQSVVLKGLTTVSDWIASGDIFDDPGRDWRPLVSRAVEEAGFRPLAVRRGPSFRDLSGCDPYPAQSRLAARATGPGVYVLEAPMGMGKTEAALYAAYRMLESGRASGIYFALPTQLTSNRMYERMRSFIGKIEAAGSPMLLHGKAWLLKALGTVEDDAGPDGSWFSAAKRGLLAPYAVGTVDQALMSVIAVKHSFVRACGLAGKVVILDEVHSYDDYTGTLLDVLVKLLEGMGCTVIILSATLTRGRRSAMLGMPAEEAAYPLITSCAGGAFSEVACPPPSDRTVRLSTEASEDEAVEEALRRAEEGQQVLWIENTVDAAQAMYRLFAARAAGCGLEAGLLHSRFTPADRERNEQRWTSLCAAGRAAAAGRGRILVGTQVLEQSLDLDADFMVTRFCPADILFQRLGRLWRSGSTVRPAGAVCEAWLLAPGCAEALAAPQEAFGLSGVVYSPYVLARSLEVWAGRTSVRLPSDIRPMM